MRCRPADQRKTPGFGKLKRDLPATGDDDQIVPIEALALAAAKLIKGSILKIYEGAPHGLLETHKARVNEDLLEFLRD